jgi:amidase
MLMRRSAFCVAVILSLPLAACSKKEEATYAVEEVPLAQVSADLAAGKTTSVAATKAYIARIKALDGPLHSVIVIAPDALDQAAASDKRRKDGKSLGPLDGVPLLFKDNIDTVGMPTTAGSYALKENLPAKDSEVARRLRAAGVVVLGKNNLSQFAGFRTTSAFNSSTVGGGAFNPYNLENSTCGSSSGSGVASASSFAAAAIGTETDGSVVCPSSTNGLVGIKPTIALVSRRGIVPISHTQDSSGPMARTVTDAAMLLTVMAGSDPADPQSAESDAHKADYVKGLDAQSLKGARLGVLRGTQGTSEGTEPVYNAALEVLKAQGAELIEIPRETLEDLSQEQLTVLYYDFKQDLAAYLATTSPDKVKVRTLADLMAFDKTDEHEKVHGQEVFEFAEATTNFDAQEYKDARATGLRKARTEGIDKWLADNNITAVLALTNGPGGKVSPDGFVPPHGITKREGKGDKPPHATTYASIAGYPNLTVPMGLVGDMPVGLTFIGPAWSEQTLLSYGYAYEQASHARVPPAAYKAAKK